MNTDKFLIDTTCWIFFFRAKRDAHDLKMRKLVKSLEQKQKVVTCGMILAEFIQGLGNSESEIKARIALERHECLPMTKKVFISSGEISQQLMTRGLKTPLSDCLIAAVCLEHDVTLVTDDPHFKRFKNLRLKYIA